MASGHPGRVTLRGVGSAVEGCEYNRTDANPQGKTFPWGKVAREAGRMRAYRTDSTQRVSRNGNRRRPIPGGNCWLPARVPHQSASLTASPRGKLWRVGFGGSGSLSTASGHPGGVSLRGVGSVAGRVGSGREPEAFGHPGGVSLRED